MREIKRKKEKGRGQDLGHLLFVKYVEHHFELGGARARPEQALELDVSIQE
jgi:hypothetical protein